LEKLKQRGLIDGICNCEDENSKAVKEVKECHLVYTFVRFVHFLYYFLTQIRVPSETLCQSSMPLGPLYQCHGSMGQTMEANELDDMTGITYQLVGPNRI
jgi:hypothetical protein